MPEREDKDLRRRSFWSGTITFGLVSIPVALLPAHRPGRASLRMLAPDGIPLQRRYYCPGENQDVPRGEIVRGYEIRKDEYVLVSDEELEALEPKKSREIDLRRFVPLDRIDPSLFDRPYFLVPSGQSAKPYRLLAEVMERTGRAGIATFVMRTREYLVAIIARNGLLLAETLRFANELRSPETLRLPEPDQVPAGTLRRMEREIAKATRPEFDPMELSDPWTNRLLTLVERKRAAGADVVRPEEAWVGTGEEDVEERPGKVLDIMKLLKQRLGSRDEEEVHRPAAEGSGDRKAALREMSKSGLYGLARELDIPGRSAMTREELIEALSRTETEEVL